MRRQGDASGRPERALTFEGRAADVVAGGDPEVGAFFGVDVGVCRFGEIGGEEVAEAGRAVRSYIAICGERLVIVEVVVVCAVDGVPVQNDGGAFECVSQV